MIDCTRLHTSCKDYNEKSRAWQVGDRRGFFLESHVKSKPNDLTTFVIEVLGTNDMRFLHEFSYKFKKREQSIQDFLQNFKERTEKTAEERRQKLVTESKKHLDEVCKQHKVKPQFKQVISDLMDKVPSDKLDDQVFQG